MLVVWYPTRKFLNFLDSNNIPYRVRRNDYGHIRKVTVETYRLGSFSGCIGNAAKFNGRPI